MMALLKDIWESFQRLPLWVRLWIAFWLVPTNAVSVAFILSPNGLIIALLAIAGMALNVPIMIVERGFSRFMALPHLLHWPACVWIALQTALSPNTAIGHDIYLWILIATNIVSLAFDIPDFLRWLRGARAVA